MQKLILHPNPTAQWHALINDACKNCNKSLHEDIESYLVFLLMRFTNKPDFAKKIVAFDMLESYHQIGNQKRQTLQEVGDNCLIFSGLFPEVAYKRRLKVEYYVNIGKTAYANLSHNFDNSFASLFKNLSKEFTKLMDVLLSMRKINSDEFSIEPILAEEIWAEFQCTSALNQLEKYISTTNFIKDTSFIKDTKRETKH